VSPSRRRRSTPEWPTNLGARQKRLGRMLLILAAGLILSVFATARTRGGDSTPVAATSTPTAAAAAVTGTASATSTVAPGSGRVELERRADGWYLPAPETWPLVAVAHIVDGDTLDVRASGVTLRVRVYGINTTERGEACYAEGTKRLEALAGREVRLVPDRRQQDSFDRELRYLFTPAGRSIDAAMVEEGVARAWRDDGALRSTLVGLEDEAKAAKRGCLWAAR